MPNVPRPGNAFPAAQQVRQSVPAGSEDLRPFPACRSARSLMATGRARSGGPAVTSRPARSTAKRPKRHRRRALTPPGGSARRQHSRRSAVYRDENR
ncbi:hypothetical protein D5S19_21855 [Amycolatopsis panacis]|uniref:Uncharacterized protein n=1 Tax=Amycolatopsis panacis TaxID=2340917 RepID=A0A419HZ44_9PSEU|nr:hypothetical protein D5S19_21855 [Amycolatopsis panacis]